MQQIYEISKVQTLVTYSRFDINENGEKTRHHEQTLVHDGLKTQEELVEEAKSRVDQGIEVKVL